MRAVGGQARVLVAQRVRPVGGEQAAAQRVRQRVAGLQERLQVLAHPWHLESEDKRVGLDVYPDDPRDAFPIDLRDETERARWRERGLAEVDTRWERTPHAVGFEYTAELCRGVGRRECRSYLARLLAGWRPSDVEDYARRKGWTLKEAERWLSPNLGYEPED